MLEALSKRLLLVPPLLFVVSFAVFLMVSLMPGDPAAILAGDNPSLVPYIRESLRLDDPLFTRYWHWAGGALQGDLGESYVIRGQSVARIIVDRVWVTASLAGLAIVIACLAGLLVGTLAAVTAGRIADRLLSAVAALMIASPAFWIGYLFVLWFAVNLHWLPAIGYAPISDGWTTWLWHLVLPAVVLALNPAAVLSMQLRGALVDVFARDYILSARAKGLSEAVVVGKHALKNAAAPVATLLGFQLAQMLGGSVIVETVFNLPGLGGLALSSTFGRDIPVLLGLVVFSTLVVITINFLVDLSYRIFNPKLQQS